MEKMLMLAIVTGLAALGALMIVPAALIAGSSGDQQGFVPSDSPAQPGYVPTPASPSEPLRPTCVLDSTLFTGRDASAREPDKPRVGTFQCRT